MITGSIGMLSSASLRGDKARAYMSRAMVLPRTSQDRDIANPIATILSAAMMLRYSFDLDEEARAVEEAVTEGARRKDTGPWISCQRDVLRLEQSRWET